MEGVGLRPARALEPPLLLRAEVGEDLEGGRELLDLHLPVDLVRGGVRGGGRAGFGHASGPGFGFGCESGLGSASPGGP
eukprot:scaffold48293_cov29-Phaeocystis_antarctica.AAC.2